MISAVFSPFTLPCGAVLPNRLAKAAMEENMADKGQIPGPTILRLYQRWAEGGTGLLITGNVMVNGRAMTGPGGIVLEKDSDLAPFQAWAQTAKKIILTFGCKSIIRVAKSMRRWAARYYLLLKLPLIWASIRIYLANLVP